jgi:hypothetical protein
MLIGFPSLYRIANTLSHTNPSKEPGFHREQLGKTVDVDDDVGKLQRGRGNLSPSSCKDDENVR